MTAQPMPGHWLNQQEYAQQQVVESFGNRLFQLAQQCLTHTYRVVYRICELENIDYLVLRYLNSGDLTYIEFSDEWLFDGEV